MQPEWGRAHYRKKKKDRINCRLLIRISANQKAIKWYLFNAVRKKKKTCQLRILHLSIVLLINGSSVYCHLKNTVFRNTSKHIYQLIFDTVIQWRKHSFSTSGTRTTGYSYGKTNLNFCHTLYAKFN